MVTQFAQRKAIGGEAINNAERVTKLIIETRSDDTGRQPASRIADVLANVVSDV